MVRAAKNVFARRQDVALLGLSIDGAKGDEAAALSRVQEFIQKYAITHRIMMWAGDLKPLTADLGFKGTPYNVLLSAEGKVLGTLEVNLDAEKAQAEIEAKLDETLKSL